MPPIPSPLCQSIGFLLRRPAVLRLIARFAQGNVAPAGAADLPARSHEAVRLGRVSRLTSSSKTRLSELALSPAPDLLLLKNHLVVPLSSPRHLRFQCCVRLFLSSCLVGKPRRCTAGIEAREQSVQALGSRSLARDICVVMLMQARGLRVRAGCLVAPTFLPATITID